ncbi:uncharacterized protein AMSG_07465 [Thecamonas trahens ATCC 50062]|uniref:PH domain-containing protein n=1 Tax=Thecamonas trahens ATCC 50062 TaxID=461836 RepID=A0A0L0DHA2_THETB|nr:hypothetical protein AMSG_07465 [Thecamonas trahens ATCC 50062]KNC51565.1 hypothetical protein AMSG_07465 [Thecamonas trahens ATCC 50062]|eukprot:XP_013755967.1 hypothetical protein AMSG_07465 [Thecamonas trahens ATCC 50062]
MATGGTDMALATVTANCLYSGVVEELSLGMGLLRKKKNKWSERVAVLTTHFDDDPRASSADSLYLLWYKPEAYNSPPIGYLRLNPACIAGPAWSVTGETTAWGLALPAAYLNFASSVLSPAAAKASTKTIRKTSMLTEKRKNSDSAGLLTLYFRCSDSAQCAKWIRLLALATTRTESLSDITERPDASPAELAAAMERFDRPRVVASIRAFLDASAENGVASGGDSASSSPSKAAYDTLLSPDGPSHDGSGEIADRVRLQRLSVLPAADMVGYASYLQLSSDGSAWRTFYAVLRGQVLYFYDKEGTGQASLFSVPTLQTVAKPVGSAYGLYVFALAPAVATGAVARVLLKAPSAWEYYCWRVTVAQSAAFEPIVVPQLSHPEDLFLKRTAHFASDAFVASQSGKKTIWSPRYLMLAGFRLYVFESKSAIKPLATRLVVANAVIETRGDGVDGAGAVAVRLVLDGLENDLVFFAPDTELTAEWFRLLDAGSKGQLLSPTEAATVAEPELVKVSLAADSSHYKRMSTRLSFAPMGMASGSMSSMPDDPEFSLFVSDLSADIGGFSFSVSAPGLASPPMAVPQSPHLVGPPPASRSALDVVPVRSPSLNAPVPAHTATARQIISGKRDSELSLDKVSSLLKAWSRHEKRKRGLPVPESDSDSCEYEYEDVDLYEYEEVTDDGDDDDSAGSGSTVEGDTAPPHVRRANGLDDDDDDDGASSGSTVEGDTAPPVALDLSVLDAIAAEMEKATGQPSQIAQTASPEVGSDSRSVTAHGTLVRDTSPRVVAAYDEPSTGAAPKSRQGTFKRVHKGTIRRRVPKGRAQGGPVARQGVDESAIDFLKREESSRAARRAARAERLAELMDSDEA